jgi:hypothetical protein
MTTSGSQADDEFIAPVTQGTMECLVALRYHSYNGIGEQCIADYLPAKISLSAEYERIFALKRRLGTARILPRCSLHAVFGNLCNTGIGGR